MLMKGSGLPESEADPVVKVLFSLIGCIKGETIGAGLLHWFAGVHAFVEDEKGERASLLIGAVRGDFLHIESFLEVIPIFPLAPLPQFFLAKNRKREKRKKGNHKAMKHGSKIKYAGHYFMHEKTRYEIQSVLCIK